MQPDESKSSPAATNSVTKQRIPWGLYRLPCGNMNRHHDVQLRRIVRPPNMLIPCPYNARHRPSHFWQIRFIGEVTG